MADPNFARTPKTGAGTSGTAQTAIGSATGVTLLYTAGANGAVITRADVKPLVTLGTAVPAYLYRSTDGGSTFHLARSRTIAAVTVSTTLAPAETDFGYSETAPMRLQASERLYGGQAGSTGTLSWDIEGLDFTE